MAGVLRNDAHSRAFARVHTRMASSAADNNTGMGQQGSYNSQLKCQEWHCCQQTVDGSCTDVGCRRCVSCSVI